MSNRLVVVCLLFVSPLAATGCGGTSTHVLHDPGLAATEQVHIACGSGSDIFLWGVDDTEGPGQLGYTSRGGGATDVRLAAGQHTLHVAYSGYYVPSLDSDGTWDYGESLAFDAEPGATYALTGTRYVGPSDWIGAGLTPDYARDLLEDALPASPTYAAAQARLENGEPIAIGMGGGPVWREAPVIWWAIELTPIDRPAPGAAPECTIDTVDISAEVPHLLAPVE